MDDAARPFDRRLVKAQRRRAARNLAQHDFLLREVADRLLDRLSEVNRRFGRALDIGSRLPDFARALPANDVIMADSLTPQYGALVLDEEAMPFKDASFDLITSIGSLHWVNDLPGALVQIRRILKPDGLFLAALPCGATLAELRQAFLEADAQMHGGARPHVAPFADIRDLGGLLQRAGFAMPVADCDQLTIDYADPLALMRDLRGMGESLALRARGRKPLRRAHLGAVLEAYRRRFSRPDGRVMANVQIAYMTGWAPAPDQPKPKRPGSATARLADVLKTEEKPAGESTGRRRATDAS